MIVFVMSAAGSPCDDRVMSRHVMTNDLGDNNV